MPILVPTVRGAITTSPVERITLFAPRERLFVFKLTFPPEPTRPMVLFALTKARAKLSTPSFGPAVWPVIVVLPVLVEPITAPSLNITPWFKVPFVPVEVPVIFILPVFVEVDESIESKTTPWLLPLKGESPPVPFIIIFPEPVELAFPEI